MTALTQPLGLALRISTNEAIIEGYFMCWLYLQYIDGSPATIEERLVQRLVVVEIDEGCKLLEGHVAVAVCVHFLHQQLQVFVAHLSRAKVRCQRQVRKRTGREVSGGKLFQESRPRYQRATCSPATRDVKTGTCTRNKFLRECHHPC